MNRVGIRPSTLEKFERIRDAAQNAHSIWEVVSATGIPRTTVWRGLQHFGIRLERMPRPDQPRAPYILTEHPMVAASPVWYSAFCGFFMGEGYVEIATRRSHHAPRMQINLRADDVAILHAIAERLGGTIHYFSKEKERLTGKNSRDQQRWCLAGWDRVKAVIEVTGLLECLLPAKKLRDIQIVYDCILARLEMPHRLTDEEHAVLESYRQKLLQTRKL